MSQVVAFVGPMLGGRPGLVPNPAEDLAERLPDLGVECRLVSQSPQPLVRAIDTTQCLARWSQSLNFAVIVTYSGRAFRQAEMASRVLNLARVPHAFYLKGGSLPVFADSHRRLVSRVLRKGTVIAPSGYLEQFAGDLGLNTYVIPNAFPVDDYRFVARREIGWRFIWLRAFHPIYDPETAVRAIHVLRSHGHDATLTMAGSDKGALDATHHLVAELGLGDHVSFPGFVSGDEKRSLLQSHDLFLHTSTTDNTPVSVYEAMACGLPVVGTRVGGMQEFVASCAKLVAPRQPDALARAAEQLHSDPESCQRQSIEGRRLVERHSWSVVGPRWLEIFEQHGRVVRG